MEVIFSLEEIERIANEVVAQNPHKVIIFKGQMGVGKTTLIKVLAAILGVKDTISSPTFSLVNEYKVSENQNVYHFDVYRLQSESEALDMGIDEYLYSGHWCFIEWAEKIPNLLPDLYTTINLELLPDGKRKLTLHH
ncbi:tRNA (adenosine(37)-N6)-threonylcarbamoyltransferase complex ATPase subunit type 1 TsaE [Flavobacterium sp.]|uniref:tRNA (adenosine(37)-N6)-threonylcarbamoyltransferase complex ATPase subunit type 1 TsaE n=1 Tax=Flavobacterium sp. TaxID=239 RepID=UPI00262BCDB9|nr:tRNA (adenosine(37)-N6)-threonylcarbamoyltransferase complex ATPase subunit type 1 TsaE [Flavobacterium sp.]